MGDLIYIANLDKGEYLCTIDKMTELELNPRHFQLLLAMFQSSWNGDRIKLMTVFELENLEEKFGKFNDVTEKANEIYKEFPKSCWHEARKLKLGKITQVVKGKRTQLSIEIVCECKESIFFGKNYLLSRSERK